MSKYITLVGSREMPDEVKIICTKVGKKLAQLGYIGRSGFADGADINFFKGYVEAGFPDRFVNYIPWPNFRKKEEPYYSNVGSTFSLVPDKVYLEAEELARNIHPAWDRCGRGAKALHTRNVCQVLGGDIKTPSIALYCYAPMDKNSDPKGGTRTAWLLAKEHGICCKNLYDENTMKECIDWLGK